MISRSPLETVGQLLEAINRGDLAATWPCMSQRPFSWFALGKWLQAQQLCALRSPVLSPSS
jgi:hypothetical protein